MFERLLVALGLTLLFLACGGRAARPANTPSTAPDSSQAQPSAVVAAGRIEDYTSGEPKQFVREKFWLARVGDDLVLALSDRDPHPDFAGDQCRIVWRPDAVIDARYGWFRGKCSGSMFNVNGRIVSGPSGHSMDRYAVTVSDGAIAVDTRQVLEESIDDPLNYSPPHPSTPRLADDAAVYLSLGDSLQYGCCGDPLRSAHPIFARFLSERLNRPVEWVTLAGNDTTSEFIGSQLEVAVAALERYRREGRPVVAITLSIGGNDLLALKPICQGRGSPECIDKFAQILERYRQEIDLIYRRLEQVKDPQTPIFQLNVYDAYDCGRVADKVSASAVGVQLFNNGPAAAAERHGAKLIDVNAAFRGKACEYLIDVDPTYRGHAVIAELYRTAYEALPAESVEPFVRQ